MAHSGQWGGITLFDAAADGNLEVWIETHAVKIKSEKILTLRFAVVGRPSRVVWARRGQT